MYGIRKALYFPATLRTQELPAGLKRAGLILTPEAGLAVHPNSAVAGLVSISVSANQKKDSA